MTTKWDNKSCPLCAEGILHDGNQQKSMEYRGQHYNYGVTGAFCDHCHDGFPVHDENEEAAWKSFRDQIDKNEAAELARIRKKLKLTQQEAARIAGGGHNAFSRYERGETKPVQAVLNLFRLLDHHPGLLEELREEQLSTQ